jgi:hypothetical protein
MSKVGIRISQAGISVDKAADYQKTMDERWPVLEHQFMGIVDLQNFSTGSEGVLNNALGTIADIPIYRHNLGYLPAFHLHHIAYSGWDTFNSPLSDMAFADQENIYLRVFKSGPGSIYINAKMFLSVVDRDCNKEFQAPIDIVTAQQVSKPSQYGLKILNENAAQGMDESNKSAYTFNTNAKSMLIQQHGTRTAGSPTFQLVIDHRLGYPPTYYLARKITQEGAANPSLGKLTISAMNTIQGLAKSNSITLTVRGGQSALVGDFMFIVLKDPVDTAK